MQLKKRITVSLDEKLIWYLRHTQMDWALEKNEHVTISSVVNSLLHKSIKNEKMVNLQLNSMFTRDKLV